MFFGKVHFEISTECFKIIITNLTIKLSPWQVFEAFRLTDPAAEFDKLGGRMCLCITFHIQVSMRLFKK